MEFAAGLKQLGKRIEQIKDTIQEELAAFYCIKSVLAGHADPSDIYYRDTESYLSILYQNNRRKWICRIVLDGTKGRSKYLMKVRPLFDTT